MTTANKLTIMRIALIPVFLVVLYLDFAVRDGGRSVFSSSRA